MSKNVNMDYDKHCNDTWRFLRSSALPLDREEKQTRGEKESLFVRLLNIFEFHLIAAVFVAFVFRHGRGHHTFHDVLTKHHTTIPRTLEIPAEDISDPRRKRVIHGLRTTNVKLSSIV